MQFRIIAVCTHSMPQVHAAAQIGRIQKLKIVPVATMSSTTTYEADTRVRAYCRTSSRSKAGRVPLVDVNRPRASRTRCAATRRFVVGPVFGVWSHKLHDLRLIGGLTHQTTQIQPARHAGFALFISGAKSLRAALKS